MATVGALLERLDQQVRDYGRAAHPVQAYDELWRSWRLVAASALRCRSALGQPSTAGPDAILRRIIASCPTDRRPLDAHSRLTDIALTLGVLGDLLATIPTVKAPVADRARHGLSAHIDGLVGRVAHQCVGSYPPGSATDPLRRRLVALSCDPVRVGPGGTTYLHHWGAPNHTAPTLDFATQRWLSAATRSLTDPWAITTLAMQMVAVDIALLRFAAEHLLKTAAPAAADQARRSAVQWASVASWPTQSRLGGRTTELRHASHNLRELLTVLLDHNAGAGNATGPVLDSDGLASRILVHADQAAEAFVAARRRLLEGRPHLWTPQSRRRTPSGQDHSGGLLWRPVGRHDMANVGDLTSDPTEAVETLRGALLACWTSFESPGVDPPASAPAAQWEQVSRPHTLPWRTHGHHLSDQAALQEVAPER